MAALPLDRVVVLAIVHVMAALLAVREAVQEEGFACRVVLALEVIRVVRPAFFLIYVVAPAPRAAVPAVLVVDLAVVRVLAVRIVSLDAARLVSKEGRAKARSL